MNTPRTIFAALGLLLAAGCTTAEAPVAGAQVAARVNGTPITVVADKAAPGERSGEKLGEKLERVIDREVLVQQALHEGLDRDPAVARRMEEARREVLAQAWLDHVASQGSASRGGGSDEVARFYQENPALFAQRRVYRLQELVVAAPEEKLEMVRAELSGARSLDDVAGWLKWRGLKVGPPAAVTAPAEQLPLSWLPRLARMNEAELAVFPSPLGASVVQLVQAREAPLTLEQAAPVIERFLAGRRRLELAAAETRRLRASASIEYAGEFKR